MNFLTNRKIGIAVALIAVLSVTAHGATKFVATLIEQIRDPQAKLDPAMVKELGADELGMRKYIIAFLKAGPKRDQDPETAAKLQQGHMDNISRMAKEGQLIVAGPFMDNGPLRGIYIFNTESLEVAKKWTETDPAIQAGRLELELHPWYGSAALLLVNDLHRRVQAKTFGE
jgi:uncharacterized protein YciI